MYAEMPDFAALIHYPSSEDRPAEVDAKLYREAFDACLIGLVPRLCAARALNDHPQIGSLFRSKIKP
jgi:hypothetical protein